MDLGRVFVSPIGQTLLQRPKAEEQLKIWPVDVLRLVASQLRPADLLQAAQTSLAFRAAAEDAGVWLASLQRCVQLPKGGWVGTRSVCVCGMPGGK